MQCGFNDNSSFTRAFKKYYGISPTAFKKQNPNTFSKIRQLESKNGQEYPSFEKYICIITNLKKWIIMNAKIEVKEITELEVAGITHIGVNGIEAIFEKLIKWANSKNLMNQPGAKMGRLFYDSFKITAPNKVRMSIFLSTPHSFGSEGEIKKEIIPQGRHIVGRFEITPNEFEKAWSSLFIWMNENGYVKTEKHPFEVYQNDYREHPENKFIVDLYIPVE